MRSEDKVHRGPLRWIAAVGLLLCGVACTQREPVEATAPTVPAECRAGVLPAGTPLVGATSRIARAAVPPVRLVDAHFSVEGSEHRVRMPATERLDPRAIRRWAVVETPLGPSRRSPPLRTRAEHADALLLEIERGKVDPIEVTVAPGQQDLTAVERFHRTVQLDFPESGGPTHVFEIALQPLLRGSWHDDGVAASKRFRVEVTADLPAEALRRVEVRSRSGRFEGVAARRVDGPAGSLRPGFHLRSGGALRIPVSTTTQPQTLVFHVHAAVGKPTVTAHVAGAPSVTMKAPHKGWSRHEIAIPGRVRGEIHFEAGGTGVVLIGDPVVWAPPATQRPPDVLIYMIDTLLASRIGALGSEITDVSPVMDALIEDGIAFVRATSTSPWTKPAIPSLLTGVYPLTHRVGTRNYTDRLPERAPMLQERFREAGFRTISSSASPLGSTLSGLERGFDLAHPPAHWADELGPLGHPDARQVQAAVLAFIDEDPSRPVFGYLHTLDVHEYERPMFAKGSDDEMPYDRAIRHQDAALGELLRAYAERERELVLVLVSDHGEGFGEYGLKVGHGYSVRQNQLHVPLVFHGPNWLPRGRVIEPASLVDVAPTLLDLYSLPALPHAQGRSLLPGATAAPSAVYAERTWFLWEPEGAALLARLGADGRKLVTGYARPVSWDLARSPCEDTARGLVPSQRERDELRQFEQEQAAAAARWDAAYGASEPGRIDPDDIARLRALGYLE